MYMETQPSLTFFLSTAQIARENAVQAPEIALFLLIGI